MKQFRRTFFVTLTLISSLSAISTPAVALPGRGDFRPLNGADQQMNRGNAIPLEKITIHESFSDDDRLEAQPAAYPLVYAAFCVGTALSGALLASVGKSYFAAQTEAQKQEALKEVGGATAILTGQLSILGGVKWFLNDPLAGRVHKAIPGVGQLLTCAAFGAGTTLIFDAITGRSNF